MALSSPSTHLEGDIQSLQKWVQTIETNHGETSKALTRIANLLQQVIKLNNLKSKP